MIWWLLWLLYLLVPQLVGMLLGPFARVIGYRLALEQHRHVGGVEWLIVAVGEALKRWMRIVLWPLWMPWSLLALWRMRP